MLASCLEEFGAWPNTVSESMVSSTELSEVVGPHASSLQPTISAPKCTH